VPPRLAWKRPGLPSEWVRVLQEHPEGETTLPDWVWLDMWPKARAVAAHLLEFRDAPPE
jgi:hypothetical protein